MSDDAGEPARAFSDLEQTLYIWTYLESPRGNLNVAAVVTIPHRLGKAEALRRLQAGFNNAQSSLGGSLFVLKNQWSGDHLDFRASVLSQSATGTVDVAEDHVRLEAQLPWLLALLANRAKSLVQKQGRLMLEKPVKPSSRG